MGIFSLAAVIMRVMAMHVTMRMMARHVTMRMMLRHVTMQTMAMNLTIQMVASMAMDMSVPLGTALIAVVVLMTLLIVRETTQLKVRIIIIKLIMWLKAWEIKGLRM